MAKIIVMHTEKVVIVPGTREYKIAKKWITRKIDRIEPDAAWIQVVDRKPHLSF